MKKRVFSFAVALMLLISLPFTAFSHSGRTDKNGGHKDNKNVSGLGSYHYHCGGNPPHLHNGGVCPYSAKSSSTSTSSSSASRSGTSKSAVSAVVYAQRVQPIYVPSSVYVGDSSQLEGKVYPSNAQDSSVTWSSENPEILSVTSSGKITARSTGSATVVAKTERGTETKFTVSVLEVVAEDITVLSKPSSLLIDDSTDLEVYFTPENTTNKYVSWSSSDDRIASVSFTGRLVGKGVGSAIITASHGDLTDSFEVEIKPIEATSLEISLPSSSNLEKNDEGVYKLEKGSTLQFTASLYPENTTDKTITWSVSDENIASIDENGLLTTASTGCVTVKASSSNGISSTVSLKIYSNVVPIASGTAAGVIIISTGILFYRKKKKNT